MSGSASASRFVAWSNWARLLRSSGDVGVDPLRTTSRRWPAAPHERLGLVQPVRVLEQLRQVVEGVATLG